MSEPSITLTQLASLLGALDVDKIRDAHGNVDTVALAGVVGTYASRQGPTATGHQQGDGRPASGRDMYAQRHRKPGTDE